MPTPVANPSDATPEGRLYLCRLDDRGDLTVYVWADNATDASDEAKEYATKQGWEVAEDDLAIYPVYNTDEHANVCRECGVLSRADVAHLTGELRRRLEDNMRESDDPDYDEGGPEPVMTSLGYVDLWMDGEVIRDGLVIYTLDTRHYL